MKKRKPQKYIKVIKFSNGFRVGLKPAPPFIFQDVENKYNIYRKPFTHDYFVKETGATISLGYDPPIEPPKKGTDEYVVYQQYMVWQSSFEEDLRSYQQERNNLALALGCTIISRYGDRLIWLKDYKRGEWISDLAAGGVEVTDENRKLLYLRAVVFENGQDYLDVIKAIVVEEVTMGDVYKALDYFLGVLSGSKLVSNTKDIARIRDTILNAIVGSEGS